MFCSRFTEHLISSARIGGNAELTSSSLEAIRAVRSSKTSRQRNCELSWMYETPCGPGKTPYERRRSARRSAKAAVL